MDKTICLYSNIMKILYDSENMEYLFSSFVMVAVASIVLIFIHKFLQRPTYEHKYVYEKSTMLMSDVGNNSHKCCKKEFLCGPYLDDINSFVVKDNEL